MTDNATDNPFPVVTEGYIGDNLVQTVQGRDLHRCLKVGKHFRTWIVDRIQQYGFVEGVDFVTYEDLSCPDSGAPNARPQKTKEYALTLDMGKELGMVERNDEGRRVRKYFIECERRALQAIPSDLAEKIDRSFGINRMLSHKVTEIEKALPAISTALALLAAQVQPGLPVLIRHGKTAGQILKMAGIKPVKGLAAWFGNRLSTFGCRVENNGCAEMGLTKARLFDPDKAQFYLDSGGRAAVMQKVAEREGQRVLRLVPKASPPEKPMGEGAPA